jgi:hypothetical protein
LTRDDGKLAPISTDIEDRRGPQVPQNGGMIDRRGHAEAQAFPVKRVGEQPKEKLGMPQEVLPVERHHDALEEGANPGANLRIGCANGRHAAFTSSAGGALRAGDTVS